MKPYRNRTVPYKLLAAIFYADLNIVKSLDLPGVVLVKTGKMARYLSISNSRLIEAIEYLKLMGVFLKVDYPLRGTVIIEISLPLPFKVGNKKSEPDLSGSRLELKDE